MKCKSPIGKLASANAQNKAEQHDLLDQILFSVDAGIFAKFKALFDKPLPKTDKLLRLLMTKAPWEK